MKNNTHTLRLSPLVVGTALLAAGSMLLPASAAPLTLNVVADNFTSANSANQGVNYGTNTKINIEGDGGPLTGTNSKIRLGFFRFNISTYTGGSSSGSYFTLKPLEQVSSTPQSFEIYGIVDGGASENFIETGTGSQTWNNSGYGYGSGETLSDSANFADLVNLGTLSGVTNEDEGTSVHFSSAALDDFLNNDGNNIVTFLVYNTTGTGSFNGFESKETSGIDTGSTLTVVPEPSSVVLVALGLVAALGLARKRRS
ncbi:MAG: PEP-CTERM sorting domain-containing protein [Kiritimatiellae bacterium]|jgi:hypothetical protein|nr:PEP-CTERM sorting domain-containing protein [Kiritimatiellia bacterium]